MLLSEILRGVATKSSYKDIEIEALTDDSRKVERGGLFVAVGGTEFDGHNFIPAAIERGASAIVAERCDPELLVRKSVELVLVENSAVALGFMAANFYENPSENINLVGITGTNGKTTTATLLYKLFLSLGHRAGLISTIRNYIVEKPVETINTTPNVIETNRLLKEMVDSGCEYCFMEVSSHAVVQHRISGLHFKGGVFSNLTQDHLDYHKTMESYRDAKKGFFDSLGKNAFALTNIDDRNGMFMLQNCKAEKFTYSIRSMADFRAKILENSFEGMTLWIEAKRESGGVEQYEMVTPFVGKFNAQNLMAIFATALLLGREAEIDAEQILTHLSAMQPVSGRFEVVRLAGVSAIIDYAHTPDALSNVLTTIAEVKGLDNRVITVVGCGGDRDKTKRPLMAQEAVNLSDKVVLTSDNPRTEEPMAILQDMLDGLTEGQRQSTLVIADRRQAINAACQLANSGDVILIAGKGHEDYQIIGKVKHHFDDKEEAIKFLKIKEGSL